MSSLAASVTLGGTFTTEVRVKRFLYLGSIVGLLAGTFFVTPPVLGHQTAINTSAIASTTFQADVYNIMLAGLVIGVVIWLAAALWLRLGFDTPRRMNVWQYIVGGSLILGSGFAAAIATAWAREIGLLQLDPSSYYGWNMQWYGPTMLTSLLVAWVVRKHVIQGSNLFAAWLRDGDSDVPVRIELQLPDARVAVNV